MPLAAVNAALQGLTHTPDLNYFGGADLTIATSDGIASANQALASLKPVAAETFPLGLFWPRLLRADGKDYWFPRH